MPKKIIIVGGVAAGTKVAAKIMRNCPEDQVTVIERGEFLSYAGCGLPYYVSGVVKEQKELMSTPVGVVRDAAFFQKVKNFSVRNHTEATAINRDKKTLTISSAQGEEDLSYDRLVLCTGASPVVPPIPGRELDGVYKLHGVEDAEGIKARLAGHTALDCVVVGGGLIGVEMTESLVSMGCRVTMVEMLDNILPILDTEMAELTEKHMEANGVRVMTATKVEAIVGERKVEKVVTSKGEIPADMVIVSIGVRPNVKLAKDAGLDIGDTGAILVNGKMQTSDDDIYAAGDCVETMNIVTGKGCFIPLGSTANKQGRVAANNICGIADTYPGVVGSSVCKVFDFNVARTGLTEKQAIAEGYDVEYCLAPAPDKPHFMPQAKPLFLKLIADKKTRKLLGAQAVGLGEADKRVNVAAMALHSGMDLDEFAQVDLCYAPPYSPAMDNIIVAADVMRNKFDGLMQGVKPATVKEWLDEGKDFTLLDVRSPGEYEQMHIADTLHIPLGAVRTKLDAIPRDKPVVAFCKISLRGYEAALMLKAAGFNDVYVMDGGILMWPGEKVMG